MMNKHRLLTAILALVLMFTLLSGCESQKHILPEDTSPAVSDVSFTAVTYPEEAVKTLSGRNISKSKFLSRAKNGNYECNAGYEGSGIVISPYFEASVSGTAVPVYGTLVYVGETGRGAIHSYSMIDVDNKQFSLSIELTIKGFIPLKAVILPERFGITPELKGRKATAVITSCGAYTFLFNDNDQQHAYTIFVREKADEDAEINHYRELYGENNIIVYEPGVHFADYMSVPTDNFTIYLKSGALLIANHNYDIMSDDDRASFSESGAVFGTRYAFISADGANNIRIAGRGTIDLSQLDWHERNGMVFTRCNDLFIEGITVVNCPEWSVVQYLCNNVRIDGVAVFGYKTNSDGFAVCNSRNVTVSNCFARSGDDLFEVKTLGGDDTAIAHNITFENCVAWNGKSRCFGITGEVNKPISDVTFRNCSIIYRDAVWDNNRIGGLVIIAEEGQADIRNVTFENIEIYRDNGRPINVDIYGDGLSNCVIEDVVFRNITYSAKMQMQLNSASGSGNKISAVFENITANGITLNKQNISKYLLSDMFCFYTLI
ncbi:MAG: hypothetical protein J1E34_02635 [Oscillospiraceae bacterium]|nr:hypothetical protein [Oscillospiraceae bacterium]